MSNHAIRDIDLPRPLKLTAVNNMPLREAALHYAAQGLGVIALPVKNKNPRAGSHGYLDATTDERVIRGWWNENANYNIGIATGVKIGIFVLDVDGEEGEESLRRLETAHGRLPKTATSATGNGRHLLFRDTGGHRISASEIASHLDIRTDGGYIVAPPSIHPRGRVYEWLEEEPIADAPEWLLALMDRSVAKNSYTKYENHDPNIRIPEGGRNAALTSFAGSLRSKGSINEELFEQLLAHNIHRCDPPLPEREVRAIAQSISKYPAADKIDLTDHGNALRFVALHGENLRYVAPGGYWLHWCETHWREIDPHAVLKLAFGVPSAILLEAAAEQDDGRKTALRKHCLKTQSRSSLDSIVRLSESLLIIESEKLDANPLLLSTKNGVFDLSTFRIRPHRREDYVTKHIDIECDPGMPTPHWTTFLEKITCGDDGLADFLQRVAGYCLTGSTKEQCLFAFYGHGANGKSTIIEVWREVLGPYAAKTPMTTFLQSRGERQSNDIARLRGTRFVSAVEAGRADRLNEPLLKELTGGDTITARLLYKEYFDYLPQFKIVMAVNDLPRIEAGDQAINRRLIVVPFEATFSGDTCDKDLIEKIRGELPGILAWFVDGCMEWKRIGLRPPIAVRDATDAYISSNDPLGEFIGECCSKREGSSTKTSVFFDKYVSWLRETHGLETNKGMLGRLMKKKGYSSKVRLGNRYYEGIAYEGRQV